jgi:thioredoxin reductase
MQSWRARMPAGMFLKSEGFASNLYDPREHFTLKRFCIQNGFAYADVRVPVPVEAVAAYGLSFQKNLVPTLEDRSVVAVGRSPEGFLLRLKDGEVVNVSRVIVAVGNRYFERVPASLADLPPECLSHSAHHHDLSRFKGQDVTVIGGGASAVDLAVLLNEVGAEVRLIVRRPSITFAFFVPPGSRSLWTKIRRPMSGIGGGWRSLFFADAPALFRYLPQEYRSRIMRTFLGPAAGWMMKDRIVGVPLLLGTTVQHAESCRGRVRLRLMNREDRPFELSTDHVIAATGYEVDFRRLSFLNEEIRSRLQRVQYGPVEFAPMLSQDFESSVPGLYFVGLASAHCFGPVMRFMYGAGYTAHRLSKHLSRVVAADVRTTWLTSIERRLT